MLEYFHEQIKDELEGAKRYIQMAMESKASHPAWAKMFVDMSAAELNHASNLYKMFSEEADNLKRAYKEMPEWLDNIIHDTNVHYSECYAKVKYMHDAYNK